jgi:hypothetical protein
MNIPFLLTAIVATIAVSLHVYTFEVWIWPKFAPPTPASDAPGFPATPFGSPYVTKGLYRVVWHFFTVSLLATIIFMTFFAFNPLVPYVNFTAYLLMVYWIVITFTIWIVGALNLRPGDSYIKTLIKAFQWTLPLTMSILIFWGTRP